MANVKKCWDCILCLRSKVRQGVELKTGNYGNCINENSPINKGQSRYAQIDKDTIVTDCTYFREKVK